MISALLMLEPKERGTPLIVSAWIHPINELVDRPPMDTLLASTEIQNKFKKLIHESIFCHVGRKHKNKSATG